MVEAVVNQRRESGVEGAEPVEESKFIQQINGDKPEEDFGDEPVRED